MKSFFAHTVAIFLMGSVLSCSEESEPEISNISLKSVTTCEVEILPDLLVSWCMDGTNIASPNETITFVASLYSVNDNPIDSVFTWEVESGDMEVINVDSQIDGEIARSIATIQFNSGFIGEGVLLVEGENATGGGSARHEVNLEQ